MSNGASLKRIR